MKPENLSGLPFAQEAPALALATRAFGRDRALHALLVLYAVVRDYARVEPLVPTAETLAAASGLSSSTVKRGLRVLRRFGLLVVNGRVQVPSRLGVVEVAQLEALARGEIDVDLTRATVVHRECKQGLGLHTDPKGLPTDLKTLTPHVSSEPLSLFSATTSGGSFGDSPTPHRGSYGECFCFLVKTTQVPVVDSSFKVLAKVNTGNDGRPVLSVTPEMQAAFDHWARVCKYPRTRLEGKVASAFRSRIHKDGFTVAELQAVADYGAKDPWLNGTDKGSSKRYNGWETLYYSRDRVVKYLTAAGEWKPNARDTRAVELSSTLELGEVDVF